MGGSQEGHRPFVCLCLRSHRLLFKANSSAAGADRFAIDVSEQPAAAVAALCVGKGGFQDGEQAGDEWITVGHDGEKEWNKESAILDADLAATGTDVVIVDVDDTAATAFAVSLWEERISHELDCPEMICQDWISKGILHKKEKEIGNKTPVLFSWGGARGIPVGEGCRNPAFAGRSCSAIRSPPSRRANRRCRAGFRAVRDKNLLRRHPVSYPCTA